MKYFVNALILFLVSTVVNSAEITGEARVIDGDTLKIGSQVVRLHGIDAPENGQNCERRGKKYNCGAEAENALRAMVSGDITCSGGKRDSYKRLIAICKSNGQDIGKRMVLAGQALAFRKFSTDYIEAETVAKNARAGMWAGKFEAPWDFRASKWVDASSDAPSSECPIKGNINRKGERIYHAPWSRSYKRTRINVSKGERWFCSEAEALAAGWRAPYR